MSLVPVNQPLKPTDLAAPDLRDLKDRIVAVEPADRFGARAGSKGLSFTGTGGDWSALKLAAASGGLESSGLIDGVMKEALTSEDLSTQVGAMRHFLAKASPADRAPALPVLVAKWSEILLYLDGDKSIYQLFTDVERAVQGMDDASKKLLAASFADFVNKGEAEHPATAVAFRGLSLLGRQCAAQVRDKAVEITGNPATSPMTAAAAVRVLMVGSDFSQIPALVKVLSADERPKVREALGEGVSLVTATDRGAAKAALPGILTAYQKEGDFFARVKLGTALFNVAGDEAFSVVVRDVGNPNAPIKSAALKLMGLFGEKGLKVIEQHIDEPGMASPCLGGIQTLGPKAKRLLPKVRQLIGNPHPAIQRDAQKALSAILGT